MASPKHQSLTRLREARHLQGLLDEVRALLRRLQFTQQQPAYAEEKRVTAFVGITPTRQSARVDAPASQEQENPAVQPPSQPFSSADRPTVRLLRVLWHDPQVTALAWSPDGTRVVSADSDGTVRLWDGVMGCLLMVCGQHEGEITSVAVAPDSPRVGSGGEDGLVKVWDTETGHLRCLCVGHQGSVHSVAFAWDRPWLASGGSDGTVKIWDVTTGEMVANCQGHTAPVQSVVFAPNGQTVASGSRDNTVRLWDVQTGNPVATYSGHTAPVQSVAFAPDGHWLASGGIDATVKVWNIATGQLITTLAGHTAPIRGIAWVSADATPQAAWHGIRAGTLAPYAMSLERLAVVSEGQDGTVRLWDTHTGTCLHTLSVEEILDAHIQDAPARADLQEDEHFDAHLALFPLEEGSSWVQGIKVALVGRSTHGGAVYREGRTGLEGGITFADLEPGEYRILLADDVWTATWHAVHELLSQASLVAVEEEGQVANALVMLRLKRMTDGSIELAIHPHASSVTAAAFPVTVKDPETGYTYTGSIVGDSWFHTLEVILDDHVAVGPEMSEEGLPMAAQSLEDVSLGGAPHPSAQQDARLKPKTYPLSDPRVVALLEEGERGHAELTVVTKALAFAGARVRFMLGHTTGEIVLRPTDPPGAWSGYQVLPQSFRVVELTPRFILLPPEHEESHHDDI